jgi:predicted RNase H-related nuclease YkuK (DUF458 family)
MKYNIAMEIYQFVTYNVKYIKIKNMAQTTIDFENRKFRKYDGSVIEDIVPYIKEHIEAGEDMRVIVGCDSQQRRDYTLFALTIMLYDEKLHKGAHVVFMKIRTKKERDMFTRLMNESLYSLNLADWLDGKLDTVKRPRFKNNEYDGSFPTKKVEIHVDVNPEYGKDKRNKSHIVYSSVMGMLCGSGFSVKSKPSGVAATCAADHLLRSKK